jgi:hypothetical protein
MFPSTVFTDDLVKTLAVLDYQTAIGLGKVPRHVPFRALGRRESLSTVATGDDVWNGAAAGLVYPDQAVGERLSVISTSPLDTAAGTNVQQVELHGIRLGGVVTREVLTLNGNVAAVDSIYADWIFAQFVHTERAPAGTIGVVAAGDITCFRTSDPTRVYLVIKAGGNISLNAQRMVPAGQLFACNFIYATATAQKPVSVRLRATCDGDGLLTPGVFIYNEIFELESSGLALNFLTPRIFPPTSIIKVTAYSAQAGGTVAASYGGWLEPV